MANPNIYALTDSRWSAAGTTFNAIWMDVNNGAGGAAVGATASRLLKYTNNNTEVYSIDRLGNVIIGNPAGGFSNTGLLAMGAVLGTGAGTVSLLAGEQVLSYASSVKVGEWSFGIHFKVNNATTFEWSSTSAIAASDLIIARDAANTLALRNGVNAQKYSVYNTFTDASNYERLAFSWSTFTNIAAISMEAAGTGSGRAMLLRATPITLASLPSAASAGAGASVYISDATLPIIFTTASGGGATTLPVYSDGTQWKCG